MAKSILLDECVDNNLRNDLKELGYDDVRSVQEIGLRGWKEGEILKVIKEHWDVFLTTERKEQTLKQDFGDSKQYEAGIVVIDPGKGIHPTAENIRPSMSLVAEAIEKVQKGEMLRVNGQLKTIESVNYWTEKKEKEESKNKEMNQEEAQKVEHQYKYQL